jgi:predicted metal-dependent hydrolase
MEDLKVFVEYQNRKTSSGRIVEGVIHLKISNLLSKAEQQQHIEKLKNKLVQKIKWAKRYKFHEDKGKGLVYGDQELRQLADTINAAYYNLPLEEIVFHKQESTWGTCSRKTRRIYISSRLIGAPMDLLWYVITHELCHLAVAAHNEKFWSLVGRACPTYTESRKKLKAYGYQ